MALNEQPTVWIDAEKVHETDLAVLYDTDAGEVWIPKKCIGARGDGRVEVTRKIAREKGLMDRKDGL